MRSPESAYPATMSFPFLKRPGPPDRDWLPKETNELGFRYTVDSTFRNKITVTADEQ